MAAQAELQHGYGQVPPLPYGQAVGFRVEDLDADMVCSRVEMILYTATNRFRVTPCDERIHQTVAASSIDSTWRIQ